MRQTRHFKKALLTMAMLLSLTMAETATEGQEGTQAEEQGPQVKYLLFREDCFEKFSKFDLADSECITFTFSKLVGYLIIAGATIFKLPQIQKIVSKNSVEGISSFGLYFETIGFINTLTYSRHLQLDFSVYGETFLVISQNVIIIYLIWQKSKNVGLIEKILAGSFMSSYFCVLFQDTQVPEHVWTYVSSSTLFLNILSRLPQIVEICRNGSTGQLAFATCFLAWAGSIGRLSTVLIEADNLLY